MKKTITIALFFAASALMLSCGKTDQAQNGGNNSQQGGGGEAAAITATIKADAAFVDGSASISAELSAAAEATTTLTVTVAEDSQLPAANIEISDIMIAKGKKSGTAIIAATPDGLATAGDYIAKLVIAGPKGVTVSGSPVSIKFTVDAGQIQPARFDKVLSITPELSKNFLFTGKSDHDFGKQGGAFQIKFKANKWKDNGMPDRLCTFEAQSEHPAVLVRFSNDGCQPGQLRFNIDDWGVNDKLVVDGNPYVFSANEWHVLTVNIEVTSETACKIVLYDNAKELKSYDVNLNGKGTLKFQRFELGMSWDDGSNWPQIQLFDGVVDYARAWTRTLSASEIAAGLCDVAGTSEGLLSYWIFGDIDENGLVANKAGNADFDANFAAMSDMNGNTIKGSVDNKANAIAALSSEAENVCKFPAAE